MFACVCYFLSLSVRSLTFALFMHQTQIHITTFSRTESQHGAPCHPHVISNEYIFFSLSACFRPQSFVISAPFIHLLQRNAPLSGLTIFFSCLECLHETDQQGIHAHKNTLQSTETHISSVESESNRFRGGCSEAKLTETLFHVSQIILFYASGEVLMLIYCTSQ